MIDVERVRELAELMSEHDLTEIRISEGETRIQLRRGAEMPAVAWPAAAGPTVAAPPAWPAAPATGQESAAAKESTPDDGLLPITSPMVGTYYANPDPESPPFVQVGGDINPDTTICIIEAMKVFNEIKAEVSGTVERILVNNEQAVEFGQPLMLVRPRS